MHNSLGNSDSVTLSGGLEYVIWKYSWSGYAHLWLSRAKLNQCGRRASAVMKLNSFLSIILDFELLYTVS